MNSCTPSKTEGETRRKHISPPKPNKRKDSLQQLRQQKLYESRQSDKKSPNKRSTPDQSKRDEMITEPRGSSKKQKVSSDTKTIKTAVSVIEDTKVRNTVRRAVSFPKNFILKPVKKEENLPPFKPPPFTCSRMHLHEMEWQKSFTKNLPFRRTFSFRRSPPKNNEVVTAPVEKDNNIRIPAEQLRLSFRTNKNEQDRTGSNSGTDRINRGKPYQSVPTPVKPIKKSSETNFKFSSTPPGSIVNATAVINEENHQTSSLCVRGNSGSVKSTVIKTNSTSPICFIGNFISFKINDCKPDFENSLLIKMKNNAITEESDSQKSLIQPISKNIKETCAGMPALKALNSHNFTKEKIMEEYFQVNSITPELPSVDSNSNLISEELSPIKKKVLSLRLDLPRCLNDQVGPRRKISKQCINELTIIEKSELDLIKEKIEENCKKPSRSFNEVKSGIDEALDLLKKELTILHQQDQMLLRRLLRINDILTQMSRHKNYRYPQSSPCESTTSSFITYLDTLTPPDLSTQSRHGSSRYFPDFPKPKPQRKYSFDDEILNNFEFSKSSKQTTDEEKYEKEVDEDFIGMLKPLPPIFTRTRTILAEVNGMTAPPQKPKDITDISAISYEELLKKSGHLWSSDISKERINTDPKWTIKFNGII